MTLEGSQFLMETAKRPDLFMVAGAGSWLTDHEGRRYLDFVQGWAVNCLGHCPPVIVQALAEQAQRLIQCSPAFFNEPAAELAALIAEHGFGDRVFFANSGAEANEGAIKLARKWGQKHKRGAYEIITFDGAFHGRTLATMSASGKPQWQQLYEPKVPGFVKVARDDLDAVRAAITDRTIAIMLEPIQGEAGVFPASTELLRGLRQLADAHGLLLVFDEIQTGMGRTGTLFAYQHSGVEPDIMTLGKGLGGGLPISALVTRERFCCFEPGDQGGTFNGGALMTAVARAVLKAMLEPAFLPHVERCGRYMRTRLEALSSKHNHGEVRGKGLLLALELRRHSATALVQSARAAGLLINAPREDCLRLMPALNVTRDEIDRALELLDTVLDAADAV